jgi:hypothetical protein
MHVLRSVELGLSGWSLQGCEDHHYTAKSKVALLQKRNPVCEVSDSAQGAVRISLSEK